MSKKGISIFFSVIFLLFVAAPTVMVIVDDTVDVSMFFTFAEEEEKGQKKHKDIEVFITDLDCDDLNFGSFKAKNRKGYCYKKYPKPHLNLISPPPELHIL